MTGTDAGAVYRKDLSVVAPCFNEAPNVRALVDRTLGVLRKHGIAGQIVLVDDASTDGTGDLLDDLASRHQEVEVVHHPENRGLSAGWDSGLAVARGRYVCFIDSDLQNPPEEIWRLYREITQRPAGMVQAVRSSIGRLRDGRYVLSRGLNVILNWTFGMSATDNKSGFVIAHRGTMEELLRRRHHYHYFHTFIRVAAEAKGYSVGEVETLFETRHQGRSYIESFPVRMILRVLSDVVKAVDEYRLRRERPDGLEGFLREHPPSRSSPPYTGARRALMAFYFAIMPLHKWMISRRAKGMYRDLRASQWLRPEQIREIQNRRLRRLLLHAHQHVPYYREAMNACGLAPEDVHGAEDLARLPLLGKDDVRENLHFDLFAETHVKREMLRVSTSGSTGEPFVVYADRAQLEMRWATTLRALEWTGWRFGDRQARLWHQTIGMSLSQQLRERIDAWLMRRIFIPAFELNDGNLPQLMKRIRRHRPVLVDGYAESFNFLAHYAKQTNVAKLSPRAVMSSAQIMPDQVRQVIEERFETQVFDKYGSREFSGIAYECEAHAGHHVMAESYIVELLNGNRPARPGETGEVVITDLNNYHVPLIRYRIGDLAVALDESEPCPCGRGLPRIGPIQGRSQAVVVCPNGTWLPGGFFGHFFKEYDYAVRQYQVVQEERDRIELRIIPGPQFSEQTMTEILEALRLVVGTEMEIAVSYVAEIPMVRTGKRTAVISKLGLDFQELADREPGDDAGPQAA